MICVPIPRRLFSPDAAPVEIATLGLLSKVNVAIPAVELYSLVTGIPTPTISIWVASYLPLERSIYMLDKKDRDKIQIVGQTFQKADYIYSNFISEVDKNFNDKYEIPSNFTSIKKWSTPAIIVKRNYAF